MEIYYETISLNTSTIVLYKIHKNILKAGVSNQYNKIKSSVLSILYALMRREVREESIILIGWPNLNRADNPRVLTRRIYMMAYTVNKA